MSIVYKTSITIEAWKTLALIRGDGTYTTVIIPGVLIKPIDYSFTSNSNLIVSIHYSEGWWNDYVLNVSSIVQKEYGIMISCTGGYGEIGTCVFVSTATLY